MKNIEISVARAKRASLVGWIAFAIFLIAVLLITLAFWFYSELPLILDFLAEEEGMPGMITMEMIDPSFFDMFYSGIWDVASIGFLSVLVFIVFWWRWFSKFVNNRSSRRMSGHAACVSSLIPVFGIFVNYFVLLDALVVLQAELAEKELRIQGTVSKFVLWFWTSLVTLGFLTFCEFNYWLMILFLEFLIFVCFYRFIRLISAIGKEEAKLL